MNGTNKEMNMPKITPFLWFDDKAEDAARFYTALFPGSKIVSISRYGDGGPGPKGSVMTVNFQLEGLDVVALNGGPAFPFTEAISFVINCETQEEIDNYWGRLTADGGTPSQCGWLKDKFGLSWQVVPTALSRLLQQTDAARSARVMKELLQMQKIDIDRLQQAADGR
jgi:predicted 3-demethylubiquinone-9 3-methyltransferase (glyoxalase superfamily)